MRKSFIIVCIIIIITGVIIIPIINSYTQSFNYGQPGCIDCVLDQDGDRLFISYYNDNAVIEIDTGSMQETSRFNVTRPSWMELSPDNEYLYVLSMQWPGVLKRIHVSDGVSSDITVEGDVVAIDMDYANNRIWLLHRIFPIPDGPSSEWDAVQPVNQESGRISEVSLTNFSILRTNNISTIPNSIIYSQYSDNVYTMHDFRYIDISDYDIEGSLIEIRDATTLELVDNQRWGVPDEVCGVPPVSTKWSDDGRFLAFPSPVRGNPAFSIRVIDTATNQIAYDINLPHLDGLPLGVKYLHKVTGEDVVWAVIAAGTPIGYQEGVRTVARIHPSNQQYEFFIVEGVGDIKLGDFAISPDCDTLYITQPYTGNIIKFTVPNIPPQGIVNIVTQMPYVGPPPAEIQFDASMSSDPDPCDVLTYEWDFDGDNQFSEPVDDFYTGLAETPTHIYNQSYFGPVFLRLSDNHGAQIICSVQVDVTITGNNPPVPIVVIITPMPYTGPAPASIEFNASASYDPDPGDTLTYE